MVKIECRRGGRRGSTEGRKKQEAGRDKKVKRVKQVQAGTPHMGPSSCPQLGRGSVCVMPSRMMAGM